MGKTRNKDLPYFRQNGRTPLVRFTARPYWATNGGGWSVTERVPIFTPGTPASMMYDEGLPQTVISATLDGEEIAEVLNDAFNEGRDFARQQ